MVTIRLENQGQIRAASPVLLHQAGGMQTGPVSLRVSPHTHIAAASTDSSHRLSHACAHSHEPPRPAHSQSSDSGGRKVKCPELALVLSEALSPSALWAQPHAGRSGFCTGAPVRRLRWVLRPHLPGREAMAGSRPSLPSHPRGHLRSRTALPRFISSLCLFSHEC